MKTEEQLDLDRYDNRYVGTFLSTYEILVESASELAAQWPEMDAEEQVCQRALFMSDWEKRWLLGALYRAGRLTDDQATRLADLDRALLEQAPDVEIAYGPSLTQLVNRLFDSGSPLLEAQGTVRLEIPIQALPSLAQVLADHN